MLHTIEQKAWITFWAAVGCTCPRPLSELENHLLDQRDHCLAQEMTEEEAVCQMGDRQSHTQTESFLPEPLVGPGAFLGRNFPGSLDNGGKMPYPLNRKW